MNNSGSEFAPSEKPPQDGVKVLPPQPVPPGFANHVVIIGKGDAIKAVIFEEPGNDGGGPGDTD